MRVTCASLAIRDNIKQLEMYSRVFMERVARSFDTIGEDAERIANETYAEMAGLYNGEDGDDSGIADEAYHKGVAYYISTRAVQQAVVNLMVAGLYHLFEQQAASMATQVLPPKNLEAEPGIEWVPSMCDILSKRGIDAKKFSSWSRIYGELRLAANAVKHGDGTSAEQLRLLKPKAFEDPLSPPVFELRRHVRPLVGEGMWLTEEDFRQYTEAIRGFWLELETHLPEFDPQGYGAPGIFLDCTG